MYKFSAPTIVAAPYVQHDMTWLFRTLGITNIASYINTGLTMWIND